MMMLPQQLESALMGGGGDEGAEEEAGQLVADWIDKVRAGAYMWAGDTLAVGMQVL